jgi:RNA polymerase sigma factor (TIGR02999 family)
MNPLVRSSSKAKRARKTGHDGLIFLIEAGSGFKIAVFHASMSTAEQRELTDLLQAWSAGDKDALERLAPRVHHELHRLAAGYMTGERPNHQLQATALINEAYIRLIGWKNVRWQNRAHFFGVSARLMRRILVDAARARKGPKRRGDLSDTSLDETFVFRPEKSSDLLALDGALTRLSEVDERKSQIVELRFFGGLDEAETALVLNVSERTIRREWKLAKAWLYREVTAE